MYLTFESAQDLVDRALQSRPSASALLMLLLSDEHEPQLEQIMALLRQRQVAFFGGIFPGLIHNACRLDEGAIVQWLEGLLPPQIVHLSADGPDWSSFTASAAGMGDLKNATGFIFVEAFSLGITGFLNQVRDKLPAELTYFGAGTGNRQLAPRPSVFSHEGVFNSAAVLAVARANTCISVRHGWQHHSGPFIVTASHRNEIREFNGAPALQTYLQSVPESLRGVSVEQFYDRLSGYPLSLQQEGREDVVRDPITFKPDGTIVVLSDVPENCVMYTVYAEPEWLVRAAAKAVADVLQPGVHGCVLVSDCYSRYLRLRDGFGLELQAAFASTAPYPGISTLVGVMALGEIAASPQQSLELYNKTFVACLMRSAA